MNAFQILRIAMKHHNINHMTDVEVRRFLNALRCQYNFSDEGRYWTVYMETAHGILYIHKAYFWGRTDWTVFK